MPSFPLIGGTYREHFEDLDAVCQQTRLAQPRPLASLPNAGWFCQAVLGCNVIHPAVILQLLGAVRDAFERKYNPEAFRKRKQEEAAERARGCGGCLVLVAFIGLCVWGGPRACPPKHDGNAAARAAAVANRRAELRSQEFGRELRHQEFERANANTRCKSGPLLTLTGTLTEASYGSGAGSFEIRPLAGSDVFFSVSSPADGELPLFDHELDDGWGAFVPSGLDIGHLFTITYHDVTCEGKAPALDKQIRSIEKR